MIHFLAHWSWSVQCFEDCLKTRSKVSWPCNLLKGPNPHFALSCSCSEGNHHTRSLQPLWSGTGWLNSKRSGQIYENRVMRTVTQAKRRGPYREEENWRMDLDWGCDWRYCGDLSQLLFLTENKCLFIFSSLLLSWLCKNVNSFQTLGSLKGLVWLWHLSFYPFKCFHDGCIHVS